MKNLIFLLLLSSRAWAAQSKIAADLLGLDPAAQRDVIVLWKNSPDEMKDQKILSNGGKVHLHFKSIKGGQYTLPVSALKDLANDPDVQYIAPDRPVSAKLDNTAAAMNASIAWNAGYNGSGIAVAVVDSGINSDPNLTNYGMSRVVYRQDFTAVNSGGTALFAEALGLQKIFNGLTSMGEDQYGHGHHIAGIIAANGSTSKCSTCTRAFIGIAPAAKLIDLRVLDANGNGTDSAVIQAIDVAISLKDLYNIRVMNLSLGRPVYESYTQDPLCQAVEAAWQSGIVVVVSAGNNGRDNTYGEQGYGTITAPGNDPYVITVGAMKTMGTYTRTDDLIASYSSKGPTAVDHIVKPDIVAPGNLVVSLLAQGSTLQAEYPGNAVPLSYYESTSSTATSTEYFILSGTSMAAGAVSGAVADLLQANPNLTPDQVKALLMKTAYKTFPASSTVTDSTGIYTDYYDIFTVGAGYIDLGAALSSVNSVPDGSSLSPTAVNQGNGIVSLVYSNAAAGEQSIWGAQTIWGAQSVWGASSVSANRYIWGAQSIWGASNPSAQQSIWGAQSMWGASTSSAQSTAAAQSAMMGEH
jgi:serine protease AprX